MKLIVNDANILIDLIKLELLPHFFALEFEFHVTDMVLGELLAAQADILTPYIDNGTLQVYHISGEDLLTIAELTGRYSQLSNKDCSALHHATHLNAILIISDHQLRLTAQSIDLEVHGHLWVFDCMVEAKTITSIRASQKLTELCEVINTKLGLPPSECSKRIKRWTKL